MTISREGNTMKTWEGYKGYVKENDPEAYKDLKEIEEIAHIITTMINKRNALGISQRQLAKMCDLSQSSIAKIECLKTTPNFSIKHFRSSRSITN